MLTAFEGMKVRKASLVVRIRKLGFKSTRSEKLSHTIRPLTLQCAAVCAASQIRAREHKHAECADDEPMTGRVLTLNLSSPEVTRGGTGGGGSRFI